MAIIRERHKKSEQNTDERQGVKQHKQAEKQISRPSNRFDRVSTQSAHHTDRVHTVIAGGITQNNHKESPHRDREWEHNMSRCRHQKEFTLLKGSVTGLD